MEQVKLQLEQLGCPSCVKKIEAGVQKQSGVESVEVLFNSSKAKVSFDEEKTSVDQIKAVIEKLGYAVKA
ncbi:heavy-metal-associated domain-containing protein [Streptohalobacillus salinus]|uniref:Heavy-metal-associated domain-containing protein n=1 Tax=Streptohalobacillus salinus TaxID=621096 RepID=A0A2V3WG26_9BACI|nr:cation transporter [Streptohalobacillus salinus]PXW92236.1 heavy-metal-associated domain-containing protein [Streptohalobacillus salinus]